MYVAAIADVLALSRDERDQLACAADLIEPINGNTSGINACDWGHAHVPGAAMLALHAGERWAGTGWPAGLPADAIPYGSRILAVAQAWTDLTAKGTQEMTQAEAMLALAAQISDRFRPRDCRRRAARGRRRGRFLEQPALPAEASRDAAAAHPAPRRAADGDAAAR